jgi:putative transposase
MNFRRYYIPGSAVFVTQVVQDRKPVFQDPGNIALLYEILHNVQHLHPFSLIRHVLLSDHFHLMFQPTGEDTFSDIMHSLKPNFTKEYKKLTGISPSEPLKLWQKRFWDHVIRDDTDLENHLHYIHFNPVKHGYAKEAREWRNSSYIEWEERGLYLSSFKWDEPDDMNWGE